MSKMKKTRIPNNKKSNLISSESISYLYNLQPGFILLYKKNNNDNILANFSPIDSNFLHIYCIEKSHRVYLPLQFPYSIDLHRSFLSLLSSLSIPTREFHISTPPKFHKDVKVFVWVSQVNRHSPFFLRSPARERRTRYATTSIGGLRRGLRARVRVKYKAQTTRETGGKLWQVGRNGEDKFRSLLSYG